MFETTKSTKGASKMRRDLLNSEISQLRDLLPLPPSTRQRLSQLQLMALVCVYVRKSNYFLQVMKDRALSNRESPSVEFLKAMSGFLMMLTQGGKLLYISDNAAEYLGHSMEDLLIHGDSVFDIIDKQDHASVQAELIRGSQGPHTDEDRLFLCRMNVSRNARRQMRFGDQKVVLVQGHFLSYLPLSSRNEPVFLAQCTPVAMPETRESVVQGATNVFTSVHTLDMKLISIDKNGEFYLGYSPSHLSGVSWYHLLHPDNLKEAQMKHRMITSSEQDRSCIMLIRLQTAGGSWCWVHCVLQVKESSENLQTTQQPSSPSSNSNSSSSSAQQSQQPVIVATNQVLGEKEASVLRANSWLYHYYAMQSKLQYGISYDHTQRMNSYYPQVPMTYQPDSSNSYMPSASLGNGAYPQAYHGGPSSTTYPLSSGSSYLQPYPHPYSMRLSHGLDYAREHPWNYYNSLTSMNGVTPQQTPFSSTTPTTSPPSTKPSKRISSTSSSPRRSPQSTGSTDISDSPTVATPVAVRATITAHPKLTPEFEDSDSSWKASPQQEVPEYPDFNPFLASHYGAAPQTKLSVFAFESSDMKDVPPFHDHHVPSRDSTWYSHAFVR